MYRQTRRRMVSEHVDQRAISQDLTKDKARAIHSGPSVVVGNLTQLKPLVQILLELADANLLQDIRVGRLGSAIGWRGQLKTEVLALAQG